MEYRRGTETWYEDSQGMKKTEKCQCHQSVFIAENDEKT